MTSAHDLWTSLASLFTDNKDYRAIQLEEQFKSLKKGSLSIHDYCQKIKTTTDSLEDVDHPITNKQLVLQTLYGLPKSYGTVVNLISFRILSPPSSKPILFSRWRKPVSLNPSLLLRLSSTINPLSLPFPTLPLPITVVAMVVAVAAVVAMVADVGVVATLLCRRIDRSSINKVAPHAFSLSAASHPSSRTIWQQRLGHPGDPALSAFVSRSLISVSQSSSSSLCNMLANSASTIVFHFLNLKLCPFFPLN